ncbi:MAG: hypothetical protein R3288_11820, partial [Woeseiaceae bacterium]|nr:hypothetical protein [Woeseiaceae bacterium]
MAKKKQKPTFEFSATIDGLDIVATPNRRNADLDRLLGQRGADSFVFIPLVRPQKKRRSVDFAAAKSRARARLPANDWYDGELRSGDGKPVIPGVLAFDLRRHAARAIAEKLGVKLFFWGTAGAPVEQHAAKIFEDDDSYSWKTIRRRAFGGLFDLFDTVRNIEALPTAVTESQTTMQRFRQLVFAVLGVSVAAGLLYDVAVQLLGTAAKLALYPVVIPAVIVGLYLRVLARKGEAQARDFTAAEAEDNWIAVAPHLLALWALCFAAVTVLTWSQTVPETELGVLGRTSGVSTSFIICVWMLLPIANSRSVHALVSSAVESGITAAISIFVIKVSLYVTDQITDALWGVLAAMLPFAI